MREYTMVNQRRERVRMKFVVSVSYADEIWDSRRRKRKREDVRVKKNGRKAGLTLVKQGFTGERAKKATKGFVND